MKKQKKQKNEAPANKDLSELVFNIEFCFFIILLFAFLAFFFIDARAEELKVERAAMLFGFLQQIRDAKKRKARNKIKR